MTANSIHHSPRFRALGLAALALSTLVPVARGQGYIYQSGRYIAADGRAFGPSVVLAMQYQEPQLDTIPSVLQGDPVGLRTQVAISATPWTDVSLTLVDGPVTDVQQIFNVVSAPLPWSMGTIPNDDFPDLCFGTPYSDATCLEVQNNAPAGAYLVETVTGGQLNPTCTLFYVGQGLPSLPATAGTSFGIVGTSDGGLFSFGLTSGPAGGALFSCSPGILSPILAQPAMITGLSLPPGSTAADFVTLFRNQIALNYPGWTTAPGTFSSSYTITPPNGDDFYLWIGDGTGNVLSILGAQGAAEFNPIITSGPGTPAGMPSGPMTVHGLDLRGGQAFQTRSDSFGSSFRPVGSPGVPIHALDYDLRGEFLWAVRDDTLEYGVLDAFFGDFIAVGTLSGPTGNVTGLTAASDESTWYLSEYVPGSDESFLWRGDVSLGTFVLVGKIADGEIGDVAINTSDSLFGLHLDDDALYSINTTTGAGMLVGALGHDAIGDQGMDFDWSTGELYAAIHTGSGTGVFASLDPWYGSATVLESTTVLDAQMEIAILAPKGGLEPSIYCTAKTSSAGCVTTIATTELSAQPTSGLGGYAVLAQDVQGFKTGLVFISLSGAAALPFAGGTLCMFPPLGRGPIMSSGGASPSSCTGSFATIVNDGNAPPIGLDPGPGNSAFYQYWYRDPANGAGALGTALSNAAWLTFD